MARGLKTGARQRGTPNRSTVERRLRASNGIQSALNGGLLPLDVMLARMRDEPLPNGQRVTDEQFQAAVAAAAYVHPWLAAVAVRETPDPVALQEVAEIRTALIRRLQIL